MPFMKGNAPIRRTIKYLEAGKIYFRDTVKIFTIAFNVKEEHHRGARDLVFWNLPQIQYKNPKVQCLTLKNIMPIPFIKIYFDNAKNVLIDIDSREKEEILNHLASFSAVCKTKEEILHSKMLSERKTSAFYFGFGCKRHCMCEVLGQVPCSSLVTLPMTWRGRGCHDAHVKKLKIPPCYMEKGLDKDELDEE